MWSKEEIGQVIKESRLSAGLTQVQVAEILGRPQNTISAWEMGRAQPDANTLFELFQVLGRSVDEAFGFSPSNKTAPLYSSEAMKLARDYDELDGHGRRIVRLVADEEKARCLEFADSNKRPMILAAARSGGVSEIEEIHPDELPDSEIIP